MADAFVDSNASGNDDGLSKTNAAPTIVLGLAAAGNGDKIFVHTGTTPHAESGTGTLTWAGGVQGAPKIIVAIDFADDSYNPIAEGGTAQILLTGGADISLTGYGYIYGLGMQTGDDLFVNSASSLWVLEECKVLGNDSSSNVFVNKHSTIILNSCFFDSKAIRDGTLFFNRIGNIIVNGGKIINGSSESAQKLAQTSEGGYISINNFDMSAQSNGTLAELISGRIELNRIKVNAGVSLSTNSISAGGELICHSIGTADEYYSIIHETEFGIVTEDTGIYLDATYDGTTGYSVKMVSDAANADEFTSPLRTKIGSFFTSGFGSQQVVTVEITFDRAADMQDDEFWIDLVFQDETDQVLGKWIQNAGQTPAGSRMANILSTPANLASSGASWTGTSGFANGKTRKVATTITAAQAADKQVVTVWGNLCSTGGVANTVYVDPKIGVA